jgi:hydroxymethylpyrimidine/phosphomethylpyrimidine kinase
MKQVLTIAGSDSGGGAGIQADLKAFAANGVYGLSVITSVTSQNTKGVVGVHDLPVPVVVSQLDAIFDDFDVAAVKTGMLSSAAIVEAVSKKLKDRKVANLVVDPVMIAKSGHPLLEQDAVDHLTASLIPLAFIITPNVHEAERLSGLSIKTVADARQAAKAIHKLGCRHVLIKGGHLLSEKGTDLLYDGRFFNLYKGEFIDTPHTHGTGCTFASAIAAQLAKGVALTEAVRVAKAYMTEAIRHHLAIGHGRGPTNHFYFLPQPGDS